MFGCASQNTGKTLIITGASMLGTTLVSTGVYAGLAEETNIKVEPAIIGTFIGFSIAGIILMAVGDKIRIDAEKKE